VGKGRIILGKLAGQMENWKGEEELGQGSMDNVFEGKNIQWWFWVKTLGWGGGEKTTKPALGERLLVKSRKTFVRRERTPDRQGQRGASGTWKNRSCRQKGKRKKKKRTK